MKQGILVSILLQSVLLAAAFAVYKPVPPQRVGFRVEKTEGNLIVLRPIYPAKIGGELIEGLLPKKGELLTCSVHDEVKQLKDKDGQVDTVHKMVLYCLSGQKVVVIGVEY